MKGIGIVVSGGPAPGINSVISAVVIEARNRGVKTFGLREGFTGISQLGERGIVELNINDVSKIHNTGGSILGTSRSNPLADATTRERFRAGLAAKGIDGLVVIGGDGSAFLSGLLTQEFPELAVIHVPKTIDNDLILPNDAPSFGFETARHVSQSILDTLMVDARTTGRWFLVTTMGRRTGFLALGAGIASGATLTVIPEEFRTRRVTLDEIAEIVLESITRRSAEGKPYGLALFAEGLAECLDLERTPELATLPKDHLGRPHFAEIEFSDLLRKPLQQRCEAAGLPVKFICKNIGYELRCHTPIAFDIEYTRFLGFGAVELMMSGTRGVMVTRDHDRIGSTPLVHPNFPNGTPRPREVDIKSDYYRVARSFMIR